MKTTQPARPAEPATTGGRATMQAIVQDRYGTAAGDVLRLERIATPAIAAREVLVRVRGPGWTGAPGT